MITSWDVYWVLKLDDIRNFLIVFSMLGIILGGFTHCAIKYLQYEEEFSKIVYLIGRYFTAFFISLLLYSLIPSTKQMIAVKLIPKATSKEVVKVLKELINEVKH